MVLISDLDIVTFLDTVEILHHNKYNKFNPETSQNQQPVIFSLFILAVHF